MKTNKEMLEMQFRRAKSKGYADNFDYERKCAVSADLIEGEECVVRIHGSDKTSYHLTSLRVLHQGGRHSESKEILVYGDVKEVRQGVDLRSLSKYSGLARKLECLRSEHDKVRIEKEDGTMVDIGCLGDSWLPFLKFLSWHVQVRGKE